MIVDFEEFTKLKQHNKPILSLDVGKKRIGVALSDKSWMLASPSHVIINHKFTQSAEEILKFCDENDVCGIVIGLPLNFDGSNSKIAQSVKQFARNLAKLRDIPIYLQDERFTSIQAEEALDEAGLNWSKRKDKVDKIAASIILKDFIESCERQNA